ncbi:MAG: hypothetical protein AAGU21_13920 [Solidesulfovibrio sp.]|uniref:hypothetical protein n=1 Tax=Solidesulfovibrio sp. TaxID=2910990 RepID=UPI00315920B7
MRKHNRCEPPAGNPTPRTELLAKINAVTAGMAQWHELLTAMVEAFQPTASNLAQVAKLGATLLMQEAMELAELSKKLTTPMEPPAVVEGTTGEVRS